MKKNVCIIDYKVGNIRSLINALISLNVNVSLTDDHDEILNSDAVILPGVGSFHHGMSNLLDKKLDQVIFDFIDSGKPVMGICLGMQLMMKSSEEFVKTEGLGIFDGHVKKLPDDLGFSVPHIGWEQVNFTDSNETYDYFFCHSYVAMLDNKNHMYAECDNGFYKFCAAVMKENVVGYQFHPEKSGKYGIKLIQSFVNKI